MSRIGERIEQGAISTGSDAPRYVVMPAASSAYWTDGRALDSGTAHILRNNVAHLASESVNHLCWAPGPGAISWVSHAVNSGWGGYEDADNYTAPTTLAAITRANAISWDWRTAMVFGPFRLTQDRLLDTGGYGPRLVHVSIETDCTSGAGVLLYAALTSSEAPPDQNNLIAWTYTQDGSGAADYCANGYSVNGLTLTAAVPASPNARWTSRKRSSSRYSSHQVQLTQAWLWTGWRLFNVGGDLSEILSVSAFEYR